MKKGYVYFKTKSEEINFKGFSGNLDIFSSNPEKE